jgi:hypothetical protein
MIRGEQYIQWRLIDIDDLSNALKDPGENDPEQAVQRHLANPAGPNWTDSSVAQVRRHADDR